VKYLAGYTDFFLSPVTGLLKTSRLPPLQLDYIWVGGRDNQAQSSPALIDIRLDMIDLRHQLYNLPIYAPLDGRYLTALTDPRLPKSQSLQALEEDGLLKTTDNTLKLATPDEDYLTPKPSFLTSLKEDKLENSQSLEALEEDGLLKTVDNTLKIAAPDKDYITPDGLEKELEPIKEEIKELQEWQKSAEAQFEEILGELEAQQVEIDGALSSIAAVEGEIFGLQAELFGVEATVLGLGISLSIVEGEVSSLKSDVRSLEGDVSDLEDFEKTAKEQIVSIETNLMTQEGEITALQTSVGGLQKDVTGIQGELIEIENAFSNLELSQMPSGQSFDFGIYTASDLMNASLDAILAAENAYDSSQKSLDYSLQSLSFLQETEQFTLEAENSAIRSRLSEQSAFESALQASLSAKDAEESLNQSRAFRDDSEQAAVWASESEQKAHLSKEAAFESALQSSFWALDSQTAMNQAKAFALKAEVSSHQAELISETLQNQPIQLIGDVIGYGTLGRPIFTQLNVDFSKNNPIVFDPAFVADLVYGTISNILSNFDGFCSLQREADLKIKTSYVTGSSDISFASLSLLNRQNNGFRLKSVTAGASKPAFSLQSLSDGVITDLLSFKGLSLNLNGVVFQPQSLEEAASFEIRVGTDNKLYYIVGTNKYYIAG
jgi:hypothetical protein